jgi:RNA polymerase sigma-70 factor (ECF subfamily)
MPINTLSDAILELSGQQRAIPDIEEFWCLPQMGVNPGLENDGDLLQLMIAGQESGFVTLYRKYQLQVYRFSLQISGSQHVAEDVTQETFLLLMRAPHKYHGERGPLVLYLLGIARKLAGKRVRRERRFDAIEDEQELPQAGAHDLAGAFARKEQEIRVRNAILFLPRKYREVIVLCSLQELSYEQAAAVIGTSIGTVRSRIHRAKKLLLRKLSEGGLAPEALPANSVLRYDV